MSAGDPAGAGVARRRVDVAPRARRPPLLLPRRLRAERVGEAGAHEGAGE